MNIRVCLVLFLTLCMPSSLWAETPYGQSLTDINVIRIAQLTASPEKYLNTRVKIAGVVDDVCPMKGCWVEVLEAQSQSKMRVKVRDGEVVFPVQAKGQHIVAEGILRKIELSKRKAVAYLKHEAEEKGQAFDAATVTGPMVIYQLEGLAAVIDEA